MSARDGTIESPPIPASGSARALAPDLARGFMLLFIALVNANYFLTGTDVVRSVADQVIALVQFTTISGRAIPLFAILFGYGMVQLMRRLQERDGDWAEARRLLRRRGWWLLAIGLAHAALVLTPDILGAYGLALLLFVGMLRVRDSILLWTAGAMMAASLMFSAILTILLADDLDGGGAQAPSLTEEHLGRAMVERIQEWALYTPFTLLTVVLAMVLLGIWAARRRILDEPVRHRVLLRWTAVLGLGTAFAGGLPDALIVAELWTGASATTAGLLAVVHDVTGWAGGLGWAAVIALLAARLQDRRGPVTTAIEAVGQRSLSCYLAQSAVFAVVFAPYFFGGSATISVTGAAVVGAATWCLTVVVADLMRRSRYRGPAETVLRRFTYSGTRFVPTSADRG
ncbi:DUF418 domain-containing protein [Lipingzhangella sp. LS1_29]|uniref:DUF418 domain-containing protein n=1 Tax=Lipingzhangella rawalii TaxID=2055835 RepID=A0ABU2HAI2_9ACTN|nr:DUF418 domain-containing protein [Lipingzhangella rawalii]MDS1272336.1 DUF418 domain-containing protein [Lipingzhangella rawalii]